MLFYLSSVEEGGESTFPVADNRTYDEQASVFHKPAIRMEKRTLNTGKDTDLTH